MVHKIKVLIVDDSSLIRQLLQASLKKEGGMEVAGVAKNGKEAIEFLQANNVDIIILDAIMPEMDGMQTLRALNRKKIHIPVIMYSSISDDKDMGFTKKVINAGAIACCQKPVGLGGGKLSSDESLNQLLQKVKEISNTPKLSKPKISKPITRINGELVKLRNIDCDLIVIGSSTGGPDALKIVLGSLQGTLPPILIAQHMPEKFTAILATSLDKLDNISVKEAEAGDIIHSGNVYLAPGNFHMTIKRREDLTYQINLNQEAMVNSCRPSVDVLFKSVADTYIGKILVLVLTGMGNDGYDGVKYMKKLKKVTVITQDKESSTVWGMPALIHQNGLDDACLDIKEIGGLFRSISVK